MADICSNESAAKDKNMRSWIISEFLFAIVWSLGATGDIPSQQKFDTYFRDLTSDKIEEYKMPVCVGKIDCPIPPEGTVYDYKFDANGRGKWTPWLDIVRDQTINPNIQKLSDIIVPTVNTARYDQEYTAHVLCTCTYYIALVYINFTCVMYECFLLE